MFKIYKPEIHEKAWGQELWIRNNEKYCGKILKFNRNASFSFHFHILKEETWYVSKGIFNLQYIDTNNAIELSQVIYPGECIHIPQGHPHKLTCFEEGEIFEISTQHFENDSYRIAKGDSQK